MTLCNNYRCRLEGEVGDYPITRLTGVWEFANAKGFAESICRKRRVESGGRTCFPGSRDRVVLVRREAIMASRPRDEAHPLLSFLRGTSLAISPRGFFRNPRLFVREQKR
jgi:hypothetical protein